MCFPGGDARFLFCIGGEKYAMRIRVIMGIFLNVQKILKNLNLGIAKWKYFVYNLSSNVNSAIAKR